MKRQEDIYYLFSMIRYGLSGGEPPTAPAGADWEYLYRICRSHKIEEMVCYAAEKLPETDRPPAEIMEKLESTWEKATAKEAVQYFSLEELLDAFEEAGVDCMPLKGALLKQFYPRPDIRKMADLDILYKREQEEKVDEILLGKGYVCAHKSKYDTVYFRKPYMNVEMHHALVEKGEQGADYYKNVWERLGTINGKNHIYGFSWEDYYIYMITHAAKHMGNGGTGIRSLVDLMQFLTAMEEQMDWEYTDRELEKIGLTKFERHMKRLVEIWFYGGESTLFYDGLTEYMVDGGIYGTMENYKVNHVVCLNGSRQGFMWGKLRAQLETIFLPFVHMKQQYSYLERYPALLPAAWIQRIFRTLFKKRGRASQVLHDFDVDKAAAVRRKRMLDELGLQKE